MTIRFKIFRSSGRKKPESAYSNVYVRIRDGREIDQTARTEILVQEKMWDDVHECIKSKVACPPEQRATVDSSVSLLRAHLTTAYIADKLKGGIGDSWLVERMMAYYNKKERVPLETIMDRFLEEREISLQRRRQYMSLLNIIRRFEMYMHIEHKSDYRFDLQNVQEKDLRQFRHFLMVEHELCVQYPALLKECPGGKVPRARGRNTTNDLLKKLRAIVKWCVGEGYVDASPFENYHINQDRYGTPICLTTEELRTIANTDLRRRKHLAQQRDIFVFQCNVGCRVSDLRRLRKSDVENGAISFIPAKTIKDNPKTVVVPLNNIAMSIVRRYSKLPQKELLPFLSVQRYNDNIKKVLRHCGITREVVILDPLTQTQKRVPLCDVASSHLARRTFVNNIYKHVKDQALVSSLTGHAEGSRAFCRYRDIDEEVKREMVGFLE